MDLSYPSHLSRPEGVAEGIMLSLHHELTIPQLGRLTHAGQPGQRLKQSHVRGVTQKDPTCQASIESEKTGEDRCRRIAGLDRACSAHLLGSRKQHARVLYE